MAGEPSDGDKAISRLTEIDGKLKSEGFSTVAALIGAYHPATAEKTKAEEARDKFNDANENFRNSLRDKGGQLATLQQENEQLKQENEQLKAGKGTPPPKPNEHEPPAKTVDEELAEVEASLTDDHRKLADEMLEQMDDEDATRVAGNKKARLDFLRRLRDDPENKVLSRPKSLWEKPKPDENDSPTENDLYGKLKQQMESRVGPRGPHGPSRRRGADKGKPQRPQADWMHGA